MLKINEVILASYSIITLLLLAYMMKRPGKVASVADKASQKMKVFLKEKL